MSVHWGGRGPGHTSRWLKAVSAAASDTTPDAFSFTDVTNAALSTVYTHAAITVTGIDAAASLTITGGEYNINAGGWASGATTVVANDQVQVRHTSSASASTATNTVLTIGGVSDTFTSTTAAFDAATVALVARMTGLPAAARQDVIDDLIVALKAASIWSKMDALWLTAAHDAQAAGLNWISTSFGLTAVNTPTFTADRGYAGNGTTSYLDTGWNPSASSLFTQDSGAIGCWGNVDAAVGSAVEMGCEVGTDRVRINSWSTGTLMVTRVNQNTASSFSSSTDRLGMSIVSRTASNAVNGYRKGSSIGSTSTEASTARPNANMFLCGYNDDGALAGATTVRLAMAFASSGLDGTEAAAMEAAVETFLTAIGGN